MKSLKNKTYIEEKFTSFICVIYSKENVKILDDFKVNLITKYNILSEIENNKWNPPIEYIKETGKNLENKIYILNELSIKQLSDLKIFSMEIENHFKNKNNRKLNINPGYISTSGMFLLTHKANSKRKRQKISKNIWQEKQYDYINGKFLFTENTFSEYKDKNRVTFLESILQKQSNNP